MSFKVDNIISEQKLYRLEGAAGVSNLCKLVRALGYKDPFSNGHLTNGGILGDLMCFLEDNPGAQEALVNWIKDNFNEEEDDDEEIEDEDSDANDDSD